MNGHYEQLPPTDQDAWSSFISRLIDGFRPKETA